MLVVKISPFIVTIMRNKFGKQGTKRKWELLHLIRSLVIKLEGGNKCMKWEAECKIFRENLFPGNYSLCGSFGFDLSEIKLSMF